MSLHHETISSRRAKHMVSKGEREKLCRHWKDRNQTHQKNRRGSLCYLELKSSVLLVAPLHHVGIAVLVLVEEELGSAADATGP